MFDIEICRSRPVVLIRFSGQLSEADFAALETSARATPRAERYDAIFDFTGVGEVALAADFVSRRGDLPNAFQHRERLYVAPHDDLKLLMRLYAAYQTSRGWREAVVLDELGEAFRRLGVAAADFRPVGPAA
jgi:hypothetical protein